MGPQLGETLVPTARQSTCGTGTIQECPSLKLPLEAITPQAPATTIPTLTITPIMGHLHLYKITPNTPKTQAPQVGPWNLLCNTSPGHPTTGVPLWLKVRHHNALILQCIIFPDIPHLSCVAKLVRFMGL